MSLPGPWYTKPWRRLASGRRAGLGGWCYLGAAMLSLMLAAFSDAATATRIGWAVIGAVWMPIGASLLATLRSSDPLHATGPHLIHARVATIIVEDSVGAGVEEEARSSAGCEYGDVARVGFPLRR